MPHSWHFPTGPMLETISRLRPESIFEIGVGYGKWGFLAREMLDWNPGRLERDTWTTRIEGVEVFPYESPLHAWVYDDVRQADALDIVDEITGFDLVIISDVIEHIEKPAALALLRKLLRTNRNVLISTPLEFFEQEIAENEHEHHVSHWTLDDFAEFTFDAETAGGAALVIVLAGVGATFPSAKDKRVSRLVFRTPFVGTHSSVAHLAKQLLTRRH